MGSRIGTEFEHQSSSHGLEIFTKNKSPMELESGIFGGGNAKSGHPIVMRFFYCRHSHNEAKV
ncbi:hypothetical protein RHGRI_017608 [Rhododendron griersonianum]|uniref:Uncharacterized protein n=1 Tax=Rhododendron griersonianum TaxID=479676 RepID=A0AAV6JYC4_9ERIC|nr:hypothetical protein RHGRI_017608 [Rhododendron griersonianum]